MAGAIAQARELEPGECRRSVEERFAPERMVAEYVSAFRRAALHPVRQPSGGDDVGVPLGELPSAT
jgi:hypothetical protein